MAAPCILRLDRGIAEASDAIEKACLLAEKACYLTRIGDNSSADAIRAELRLGFGDGHALKVSVLVMLLEGLQSYFKSLGGDAKDRLMRAQLLSRAAKNRELTAITSAWLAHIQFQEDRIDEAVETIRLAIEATEASHSAAVCRISCVMGDIFFWAGDLDSSRRWYAHARQAAVEYGDQAALGAITYNKSAFRVFDLRLKSAWNLQLDPAALQLADAESRSAANYQSAAGVTSLDHLLTGVKVGVHMLHERYSDALDLLIIMSRDGELPSSYLYRLVLLSDMILCYASLGFGIEAKTHLEVLLGSNIDRLPVEDLIIVYSNLNRALEKAPSNFLGLYNAKNISPLTQLFHAERAALMPVLQELVEIPATLRR